MLTSVSVDGITAVYSALPTGLGLVVGMVRQVQNTAKFVQLVQCKTTASASLKVNDVLTLTSANTTTPVVDMTSANTDCIYAVNDNAGVVIPAGYYFWATISGPVTILTENGATAGKFQVGNAVTGSTADAGAWAATTRNSLLLLASNASGATASRAANIFGSL